MIRLRFPQIVACGFPAPHSSAVDFQHRKYLQFPILETQFGSQAGVCPARLGRVTTGRSAGLFSTREAAIKYARDESADGNFTIVDQIEGLEFEQPH